MGPTLSWREPPEREPRCYGERVTVGRGRRRIGGYLARSERAGPGVVVLHECFGLQQGFVDLCDRLAAGGFTAFAPDLYDGERADGLARATELAEGLDRALTTARLVEAAEHLRANWHPRVGAIEFSLGAGCAMDLGAAFDLDALVVYYGLGDLRGVRPGTPVLGHFAAQDEREPLDDVRAAFHARPGAELVIYEGAGHWFANSSVPAAYDQAAASLAHGATFEFLRYHLS